MEQKYKLISKDLLSFAEVMLDYPPLEYETAMSNLEHRNRACLLQRTRLVKCDDNGNEIEKIAKKEGK